MMRFYTTPRRFYCGIDLHARDEREERVRLRPMKNILQLR
jgi:hypothetical protein